VLSVASERQLELGLFDHSIEPAKAVGFCFRHRVEPAKCTVEIGERFTVGTPALRFFRRRDCVIDSLFGLITASEMEGEQFRHLVAAVVIELFESASDSAMMHLTVAFEETPIGCLLRQSMAKNVDNPVADEALIDEFQTIELAEQPVEPLRAAPHRADQA
jgi:hypothetical protein